MAVFVNPMGANRDPVDVQINNSSDYGKDGEYP